MAGDEGGGGGRGTRYGNGTSNFLYEKVCGIYDLKAIVI